MTDEIASKDQIIRGEVAQVVSDRELILNRGYRDGVTVGMYFKIMNPNARGVTDPSTGEELGGFNVIKIVVEAVQVGERITLARTFRRKSVNVGGQGPNIGLYITPPKYVEQIERLRLNEQAPRAIAPSESVVDRGDPFEFADPEEVEDVRSISVWE